MRVAVQLSLNDKIGCVLIKAINYIESKFYSQNLSIFGHLFVLAKARPYDRHQQQFLIKCHGAKMAYNWIQRSQTIALTKSRCDDVSLYIGGILSKVIQVYNIRVWWKPTNKLLYTTFAPHTWDAHKEWQTDVILGRWTPISTRLLLLPLWYCVNGLSLVGVLCSLARPAICN